MEATIIRDFCEREQGYGTPKVDLRGAISCEGAETFAQNGSKSSTGGMP